MAKQRDRPNPCWAFQNSKMGLKELGGRAMTQQESAQLDNKVKVSTIWDEYLLRSRTPRRKDYESVLHVQLWKLLGQDRLFKICILLVEAWSSDDCACLVPNLSNCRLCNVWRECHCGLWSQKLWSEFKVKSHWESIAAFLFATMLWLKQLHKTHRSKDLKRTITRWSELAKGIVLGSLGLSKNVAPGQLWYVGHKKVDWYVGSSVLSKIQGILCRDCGFWDWYICLTFLLSYLSFTQNLQALYWGR